MLPERHNHALTDVTVQPNILVRLPVQAISAAPMSYTLTVQLLTLSQLLVLPHADQAMVLAILLLILACGWKHSRNSCWQPPVF